MRAASTEHNRTGRPQAHQLKLDLVPVNLHRSVFLPTKYAMKSDVRIVLHSSGGAEQEPYKVYSDRRKVVFFVLRFLRGARNLSSQSRVPAALEHCSSHAAAAAAASAPPVRRRALTAKRSSKQDLPTPESPTSSSLKR